MANEPLEVAQARLVSVTIPAHNQEAALPYALKSVFKQTYPFIEVIAVNSQSSHRTKDTASGLGTKVIDYEGKARGADALA